MASIYRRKGRRGWTVSWTVGGRRRARNGLSKAVALQLKDQKDRLEQAVRVGVASPADESYQQAEATPIAKHIDAFERYILHRGRTAKHAHRTAYLLRSVLAAGHVERISELTPARVVEALADWKAKGARVEVRSVRCFNAAVTALKSFSRWLRKDRRAREHALVDLERRNEKVDRRLVRRALTAAELVAVLAATERGPKAMGLSGTDRAMLYRVAVGTGFRLGELRSLTVGAFHLAAVPPFVRLGAADEKARRGADQIIRDDLAATLRAWLRGRKADEPAWRIAPHGRPAVVFRSDCRRAGIAATRGLDFHALRVTGISLVVRGAGLAVAQDWARHSTPALTKRYAPPTLDDARRALDALPPEPGSASGSSVKGKVG